MPIEQLLLEKDLINKFDAVDQFLKSSDRAIPIAVEENTSPKQAVERAVMPAKLEAIDRLQKVILDLEAKNRHIQQEIAARKLDLDRRCGRAVDKQRLYDTAFEKILATANPADLETLVDRMTNQ